jgi:hypothetical protein
VLVRNWSTHIVIGTTRLAVVRIVLLVDRMGVRISWSYVFGRGVDEARRMARFVDSGRWWRVICGIVWRVWGLMVYGCCWGWGKVVTLGEEAGIIRVRSRRMRRRRARTVVRTVATGRVGRVFVTWRGLSMLVPRVAVRRLTSFLALLVSLLTVSPFGSLMGSEASNTSDCGRLCHRSCAAFAPASASAAMSAVVRRRG